MSALVAAFRMIGTSGRGHQHNGIELMSAILADVLTFLATFIKFVAAFMATARVPDTGGRNQQSDIGKLVSAILTIIICHDV